MDTELTIQEKIFIVESKIKFQNETLFNYNLDLELHALEENAGNDEYYDNIALFKANAERKVAALTTMLEELKAASN